MSEDSEGRFSEVRAGLSREAIGSRFRAARKSLESISRATYLHYTILFVILSLAVLIRLLPLRFGAFISEFDPYFAYNNMRQIVNNGWQSWYSYIDNTAWFPFGRESVTTAYPGTSLTGALIYQFLTSIGANVSLYDTAIYTPVLMGAFAVLVTYFFARDLWGKSAGLFAALFLAFNSSLLSRTNLGFFDNEEVGIPAMILTFLFFIRATNPNRTLRATLIYSMLSSISLIWMGFSWGSFRYATEVLAIFTLALVVLKRYSPRLLLAYGITQGFFLYTGTQIPLLGHVFLTDSATLALAGVMGVLIIMQLSRLPSTSSGKLVVFGLSAIGIIAAIAILIETGLIGAPVQNKFLSTINPFIRQNIPLVASVAENRPSTWASLFLELGSLTLLAVFGFFFAFQRLREGDVLMIIFGTTAFYFAASLVRLTLILAPAISVLAAITVVELGKPAVDIMQQSVIFSRRKLRFQKPLSREFSLGILLIVLVLVVPTFVNSVQSGYTPVTIAASSLPVRAFVPDWVETLSWMNNNLPSTSVVFAWWDYGYWISVSTGLHTLADNGTGNLTQIQSIATGFMLNESLAVHLMKRYGVTHVAVFVSYNRGLCGSGGQPQFCGYGEDSKWFWMVRIGNGTQFNTPLGPASVNFREIKDSNGRTAVYQRLISVNGAQQKPENITTAVGGIQLPASNTVLGLLMRNGFPGGLTGATDIDGHTPGFFTKAFSSTSSYVLVYSVNYPTLTSLTAHLSPAIVPVGGKANITGTLSTAAGELIQTQSEPVVLEYSVDRAKTWNFITKANTTATGTYSVASTAWTPPAFPSDGSPILVRARWAGDLSRMFDLAISAPVSLTKA